LGTSSPSDDDEGDRRGDAVRGDLGQGRRKPGESALDETRQRRLADPAEAEGGQGDTELGGGDVAVERLYRAAREPSFAIPRPGQLVEPGAPRPDQGKLGRHEEGVREDENDDRGETEADRRRAGCFHTH
jgi:hypothetical protein